MNPQAIKSLILNLDFAPENSDEKIFFKNYSTHNNYRISLDFQNGKIDFGGKIKIGDTTTSNFSQPENFVVLECINRLLEKGYEPQHLELERKWPLGRTGKSGKADIVVYDHDNKALIVIECKTFGGEYDKEKALLHSSGGQLFSYLRQDSDTRFLCLYASQLDSQEIIYQNLIIQIEDRPEVLVLLDSNPEELSYNTANDAKKYHQVWKEQYNSFSSPNGIFDEEVLAYHPQKLAIKRRDLKPFAEDEGRKFFNDFAEILRHNNISDQSNAFNRILSLVLCKIVDEQKKPNEVTDFQIQDVKESPEKIQDRLQKLYADGMKKFLKEEIVYFSDDEIEKVIHDFPRQFAKTKIVEMFRKQKFYSNNEFAFKEVHNERLFNENARVLNEILQLLQYKLFRYSRSDSAEYKKQKRYLGDFFELLLDAGYKQTAGQFFTPLPIARFIVSSLPMREIVNAKLESKQENFLPLVIDYACGSGHFLIEAIDEVQQHLDTLTPEYSEEINQNLDIWKKKDWTDGFIYGVEKDYRLARTAKLACFMNGDGEANIIFGDGLEDYRSSDKKFPESFDVLVANPPYSVHGFKPHTAQSLKNDLKLMNSLTDTASEIEVLFIERMAQLLRTGGVAGVILPSSILSNAGIYTKAREILLRHFEIRAIIELGGNTFMATNTNTVTLFLKKRDEKHHENAAFVAKDFIIHNKERPNDFADTKAILESYARVLGFALEDYQTFLARTPNDAIGNSDWYQHYRRWFESLNTTKKLRLSPQFKTKTADEKNAEIEKAFYMEVLAKEKDKFEFFFLAYNQSTLIVRSHADTKDERKFIGYEFKGGRGREGIHTYQINGKHQTALYDEDYLDNPEKLNFVVRQMLLHPPVDTNASTPPAPNIPAELVEVARIVTLLDCFDFSRVEFEKSIDLAPKQKVISQWETIKVINALEKVKGATTKVPQDEIKSKGSIPVLTQESDRFIAGYIDNVDPINDVPLIVFGDHSVTFKYVDFPFVRGADGTQLLKPNKQFIPKAFYYIVQTAVVNNINKYERHFKYLQDALIPLPPPSIQQKIVSEIEAIESAEAVDLQVIEKTLQEISDFVRAFENNVTTETVCKIRSKKVEPSQIGDKIIYIGLEHIESNTGKLTEKQNAVEANLQSTKNAFYKGDVLFGKLRPYLNKVYVAEFDGVCSTDILVLQTDHAGVLQRALLHEDFVAQTSSMMKGINLPRLQVKDFAHLTIHFPDDPQQKSSELEIEEQKITAAQARLDSIASQKAAVLQKYL